jgi:hypothetical protein
MLGDTLDGSALWDANDWADEVFGRAKEEGMIDDFKVLHTADSIGGLQYVAFTVDFKVPYGILRDEALADAEALINKIVHDTDVSIRSLAMLD